MSTPTTSKFTLANTKKGASTFYNLFENKWTNFWIFIAAIVTFFMPLAAMPPDDNEKNVKDLADAKSKLKKSRSHRLYAIITGTIFVIFPLMIKTIYDLNSKKSGTTSSTA